MKWLGKLTAFIFAVAPLSPCLAAQTPYPSDAMIEGAKLCTRHLPRYEREYAIPTHLLSAIASTESGRYHEGLGMKLPWPWAINAAGKGYYFDTKEDAMAAVRKLRARGIQSIDVGCMQVNLYQHPQAFANLSEAFEPQANIAYAASFLRTLYEEGGSWKKAAAHYHSRTPSLGVGYVSQVYDSWYTIIDKLRAARLQVPESSVVAMNELKKPSYSTPARSTRVASGANPRVIHIASTESDSVARLKSVADPQSSGSYEHAHMNSIRVSSEPSNEASNELSSSYSRRNTGLIVMPTHAELVPESSTASNSAPAQAVPVVARTDAPMTTQQPVALAQAAAPVATAVPVATPVPAVTPVISAATPAPSAEIKTADSTPMQTPMPTQAAQALVVDPATGRATNADSLGELSPSAGVRRVLEFTPDHSGPHFIFND